MCLSIYLYEDLVQVPLPVRIDRIRLTRFLRISAANIGPNLFHQNRTVSWLISMPRSCRRSSTLRSESGKRTYSITAKRMISGLVLKYLNGECFVICGCYKYTLLASTEFNLTVPRRQYRYGFSGCRFPALKQSQHTLDADWHEALVSTNVRKAHL